MSKYYLILLVLSLIGCREEYWPEINKYENVLVVDGAMTNQPGPYTVLLSTSSLVKEATFIPYTNAQVKIIEYDGAEEILNETEPGVYQTSPLGIQGKIGNKYKLIVFTPNEQLYESPFSELLEPVGIDSVYAVVENQATGDPNFYYWGYQFYLDTKTANSDSLNFLWRLNSTYEYHSDFLVRYYYDGQLRFFPDYDSLKRCWKDDIVNSNYTANVTNLSEPVIKEYPLNFVNTETRKLAVRYSLEVSQYSVEDEAYNYYNQIQTIDDEQGTLYTSRPYQIKGNVQNVNDESEPVLGYFLVGGLTVKRIFVNRPAINKFRYSVCELGEADYEAVGGIYIADPITYPIYLTFDLNYSLALPSQKCMDCRQKGGTITKPNFWVDY